jgi:hypothetical protein
METTLGGDRLGSGNKQKISMRNYERSTHDLSYIWRSTMAPGTLVPFLTELGLPGDTFDIDLNVNVMTHPTIGPLFGSFKIQLDVFQCPIRLYNGKLHMNKLGIGMNMSQIKLPQLEVFANTGAKLIKNDNAQINSSCILSYLNIRGIGTNTTGADNVENVRYFNAIPYLSYWDIYKNYYANKQEEVGYVIHNPMNNTINEILQFQVIDITTGTNVELTWQTDYGVRSSENTIAVIKFENGNEPEATNILIKIDNIEYPLPEKFRKIQWNAVTKELLCTDYETAGINDEIWQYTSYNGSTVNPLLQPIKLEEFPLENIDKMREKILSETANPNAYVVNRTADTPYRLPLINGNLTMPDGLKAYSKLSSQEGLAIKTYQSDLFNNWVSTEWIDGTNGINEITSIDTSSGSFNIDTLNLSNKVYNMLNRIAISGGTYDDWLDAVYTHERMKSQETPMYMGSLIRELSFEEVVSNAASGDDPLGTLAGRGAMTSKKKGGKIRIKVDEPSYIMGIISLTPRVDYSQGNKWDVNLKTMDDFHKPALDEIGFQDLITEQMAWFDTNINDENALTFKSAGKQPAWINYMTNVNQVRGNFAVELEQMWMTLNRRYENDGGNIKDLTTYIDPSKYNHIFASPALDAQCFWVQISNDITARRKMSAKIIPNL